MHERGNNALVITWDDGLVSRLPIPYLRGWCPCAGCQGHGNVVSYRPAGDDVVATGIFEMGAYAIAIRFSDGHDAGIFSWSWLRQIAPDRDSGALKGGRFVAGRHEP